MSPRQPRVDPIIIIAVERIISKCPTLGVTSFVLVHPPSAPFVWFPSCCAGAPGGRNLEVCSLCKCFVAGCVLLTWVRRTALNNMELFCPPLRLGTHVGHIINEMHDKNVNGTKCNQASPPPPPMLCRGPLLRAFG